MGCPDRYYKRFLQDFAYTLVCENNKKLANEMYEETSDEKLEKFILDKKAQMNEKQFYFDAGRVCESVIWDVYNNDCNDGLNACIGGFAEFEYFLGLREDEDDD